VETAAAEESPVVAGNEMTQCVQRIGGRHKIENLGIEKDTYANQRLDFEIKKILNN
jgi:hypothetical protein